MPIEIRELHIKAEIEGRTARPTETQEQSGSLSEEDIQEIVAQVVEMMRRKEER